MQALEAFESLLESATRLVYAANKISGQLKLYWSNFLLVYFSASFSRTQIHQREIKAAANAFKTTEEALGFFKQLPSSDQIWVLAALDLLSNKAEKEGDWISFRHLSNLVQVLQQTLSPIPAQEVKAKSEEIEGIYSDHQNRPPQHFLKSSTPAVTNIVHIDFSPALVFAISLRPSVVLI